MQICIFHSTKPHSSIYTATFLDYQHSKKDREIARAEVPYLPLGEAIAEDLKEKKGEQLKP
jgi:hypothetical protein